MIDLAASFCYITASPWIGSYNVLQKEPREEAPDAAEVELMVCPGNALVLRVVEVMTGEAAFLP